VLGVKTRQLNGGLTYATTGQTDNQLRTLNRIGLLNPAVDEAAIPAYAQLSALTSGASLEERTRSYLDANCANCHRPGGAGPTMDARYDTPLTNQNIINVVPAKGDLGADNARIVVPKDIWRSVLYGRMNTTNIGVKMPQLARNLIDTNAVQVVGDWINTLPGTPALAPPTITPTGGSFAGSVNLSLTHPDPGAALYYTLDSSLPTTNSFRFTSALVFSNNLTLRAIAAKSGYNNSVAANAVFMVDPVRFTSVALSNGTFHLYFAGNVGNTYVLYGSTNLADWIPVVTNVAPTDFFEFIDPTAANYSHRFYRTQRVP
jgi:mono/diheme cytochrome c family protein